MIQPSFVSIHSNIKRANSHEISTRPIEPTCSVELSTTTLSSTINSCSSDNEIKRGWLVNGKPQKMDHNLRENDIRQVQNYLQNSCEYSSKITGYIDIRFMLIDRLISLIQNDNVLKLHTIHLQHLNLFLMKVCYINYCERNRNKKLQ